VTVDRLAQEINAGRAVIAGITWNSGGSRFVTIAGVQGEGLLILDPVNGQSLTEFGEFPDTYFGGATLDGYAFTQPASERRAAVVAVPAAVSVEDRSLGQSSIPLMRLNRPFH
jgi:hypothetical protein